MIIYRDIWKLVIVAKSDKHWKEPVKSLHWRACNFKTNLDSIQFTFDSWIVRQVQKDGQPQKSPIVPVWATFGYFDLNKMGHSRFIRGYVIILLRLRRKERPPCRQKWMIMLNNFSCQQYLPLFLPPEINNKMSILYSKLYMLTYYANGVNEHARDLIMHDW